MKSRYEQNEKKRKIERKEKNKTKRRKIFIFISIILVLLIVWGKFGEPNLLLINDYKIEDDSLSESFEGTRIVHFSDLHYGMLKENRLKKIVENINSLKPDVVVFTGDLIEQGYDLTDNDIKVLVNNLSNINSKLGKYAIYGNHDTDSEYFDDIMYDSKFSLLKNNYDTIYNEQGDAILLYGLDDTLNGEPKINSIKEKNTNNINYRIALVHEPDYINEFVYDFNPSLVLSGHSHGGQINIQPISRLFLPKGSKKYYKKHYEIGNTQLYVSNGLGNSIINFRLFSAPSINIYRLYTK